MYLLPQKKINKSFSHKKKKKNNVHLPQSVVINQVSILLNSICQMTPLKSIHLIKNIYKVFAIVPVPVFGSELPISMR